MHSHSIRRLLALVLHIVEVMEFLWLAFDLLIVQIENRTALGKDHSFARLVEVRPGPVCAVNDSLAGGVAYLMAFPITSMAGRCILPILRRASAEPLRQIVRLRVSRPSCAADG